MFYTPIKTILVIIIHSSKNKMEEVDDFAVILIEFSSARWQAIFKWHCYIYQWIGGIKGHYFISITTGGE